MVKILNYLAQIPKKVILWILVGGTILLILLKMLAKGTALKAKEMNLSAIIQDALDKFKLKENKKKIEELEKKPKKEDLEKDPDKVIDFYKNRKND